MNLRSHSLFGLPTGAGFVRSLLLLTLTAFLGLSSASAYEVHYAKTGYQVTSGMDYAIHYELKKLIGRHESAFGRKVPESFQITYYVFPNYEQYRAYSAKNGKTVAPQLLGYTLSNSSYNIQTGIIATSLVQVVTWRQDAAARLLSTVLHESAHAVTHAFLLQVPLWMNEGSADWFGQPTWANGSQQQLDRSRRWQALGMMLDERRMPQLRPYLSTENYEDWEKMFGGNIGMGYVVGYSIFDFFMSHPNAQQFLTQLLRSEDVEKGEKPEAEFMMAVDKNWPGGLTAFERSWHIWIKRKAEAERLAMQSKMKK